LGPVGGGQKLKPETKFRDDHPELTDICVRQSESVECRLNPYYIEQVRRDSQYALQGIKFKSTHRWTKPGSKALHKSIKKFLIPLIGLEPWVDQLYSQAWDLVRQRYVESCGDSQVIDIQLAAQNMSSKGVPGSLYNRMGYATKANVYGDQDFLECANTIWNTSLLDGRYRPFCDVNGKTEILEIGKDPRTVYCVDSMTILFQCMLFSDQHEKYKNSSYGQLWANLGKTAYGTGSSERFDWITHGNTVRGVYDFDVKKMEANIRTREMRELARLHYEALSKKCQTKDNYERIATIYEGMAECPFLVEDLHGRTQAFWKGANGLGGNPSGQVCTALDNSLFDLVLVVFAYLCECYLRNEDYAMSWFWINHHGTIMGDDLQVSITLEAHLWWSKRYSNFGTALATLVYLYRGIVLESTNPLSDIGEYLPVDVMQGKFCGMKFTVFRKPFGAISFVMDRDRMLSSIQQGDPTQPPHHHLQRMNGIRNITWADEQTRKDLSFWRNEYVRICEKDKPYLVSSEDWERAKSGWLSDFLLYRLYTDSDPGKVVTAPICYKGEVDTPQLEESQFQF